MWRIIRGEKFDVNQYLIVFLSFFLDQIFIRNLILLKQSKKVLKCDDKLRVVGKFKKVRKRLKNNVFYKVAPGSTNRNGGPN